MTNTNNPTTLNAADTAETDRLDRWARASAKASACEDCLETLRRAFGPFVTGAAKQAIDGLIEERDRQLAIVDATR